MKSNKTYIAKVRNFEKLLLLNCYISIIYYYYLSIKLFFTKWVMMIYLFKNSTFQYVQVYFRYARVRWDIASFQWSRGGARHSISSLIPSSLEISYFRIMVHVHYRPALNFSTSKHDLIDVIIPRLNVFGFRYNSRNSPGSRHIAEFVFSTLALL